MSKFTYKCVATPAIIDAGAKEKDLQSSVAGTYEKIINGAAIDGWELVNIDTVSSVLPTGCLSSFSNSKRETVTFKIFTFKMPS